MALVQTDATSGKIAIAGSSNALLFRSVDGGTTWRPLRFPPQLRAMLHTLLIHPGARNLYFAGITPETPESSGLWRSEDAGTTWRPVPGFENTPVRALAVFRGNAQIMAAGTDTGVFTSHDAGATWRRVSPADHRELQPVVSVALDPKDSAVIYAGTPHLPWKTTDGGSHWESIHAGMIDDSDVFSILVDRNRPQRVFASACSGIYRSLNGGGSWTRLPDARDASFRTYVLAQDPQYENVLFAGTTHGIVKSADGGSSWRRIAPYATHSIAFDMGRLGRIFIATEERGILRSDDNGETWQPANRGISNRRFTPVAVARDGALITSVSPDSGAGGLLRLAAGSDSWTTVAGKSGSAWDRLPPPAKGGKLTALLAPAWESASVVAATGSVVYSAREAAAGWKTLQFPSPVRSLIALDAPWMAAISGPNLYLSSDGEYWQGARVPAAEIHDVTALPDNRILAATTAGLRFSGDLGRTWQAVGGALEGNTVQAICRDPERRSVMYAARYGEILSSADAGSSWTRISPEDWPAESVRQFVIVPQAPDRLIVLTRQQGAFVLLLADRPARPSSAAPSGN